MAYKTSGRLSVTLPQGISGDTNGYRDANKPRRYRTDKTCKGKNRFVDEVSARAVGAVTMIERKTPRLWCYRCRHCAGWHLTSSDQGKHREIKP